MSPDPDAVTSSLPGFEVDNGGPPILSGRPNDPQVPHAWVVSADMGLGHLRAAYPLTEMTPEGVIQAGDPVLTSEEENRLWTRMRRAYETFSRARKIPLVGGFLYNLLHRLENISPYYPRRDLSAPTIQVKLQSRFLAKGMGSDLVTHMRTRPELPIVSTFYTAALAADRMGYPNVHLVVTDTDINRVWVAEDPASSRIKYLAPCGYAVNRLREYGIPDERIFLTGFPLPRENVGSDNAILKHDLAMRLKVLDPHGRFWVVHYVEAEHYLGAENCRLEPDRPLTVMYAVGGAGAQIEIGLQALESLRDRIDRGRIRYWLVAGVRPEVAETFRQAIVELGLGHTFGSKGCVNILLGRDHTDYFRQFNRALRQVDVLWTKPSELSFYVGLGIPLIIAPPLGAHEEINRKWLYEIRSGTDQEDPRYAGEWLPDLVERGHLAHTAMDGFLYARHRGTYKIEQLLREGRMDRGVSPIDR